MNILIVAVRFKYIGPLLDRSGIVYAHSQYNSIPIVNLNDSANHPYGQVHAIGDDWVYLRMNRGEAISIDNTMSDIYDIYAYFEGLPASKACILVETVMV